MPKAQQPKKFDYNLVVIGAGSAGLVSAYIAATLNARVALVERGAMGGDCLNTGCVPSKALLRSAKMLAYARRANEFGFDSTTIDYDFGRVMERVQRIVAEVAPHDSIERYTALGVECIQAEARILDPWHVQAGERVLSTRNIIIATGGRPSVPALPGLDDIPYLTSDNVWALRQRPRRLLVLGGGPIGCELSQAFARLGCEVTQLLRGPRLLPREDESAAALVAAALEADGVRVLTEHRALRIETIAEPGAKSGTDPSYRLYAEHLGNAVSIGFDRILLATGREPVSAGLGLDALGLERDPAGHPQCNQFLQTNIPSIYCAGDVAGPYQFTHTASHQAWYASVNALFGGLKRFKVDYRVIPWVTFTDPEIARVGLNRQDAERQGIAVELTHYPLADADRAIADSETGGYVEVLTPPGKDRILGVTIVGSHAGELLAEFVLAMRHGLGLNKILATIHSYPTLAEANKASAGAWRRAHAPQGLLRWVGRLQRWRRG